jgi:hypothetical protein
MVAKTNLNCFEKFFEKILNKLLIENFGGLKDFAKLKKKNNSIVAKAYEFLDLLQLLGKLELS